MGIQTGIAVFVAFSSSFSTNLEDLLKNKSRIDLFPVRKRKNCPYDLFSVLAAEPGCGDRGNFLFPGKHLARTAQTHFILLKWNIVLDINAAVESCMQPLFYVNFLVYRTNYECWACMTGRAKPAQGNINK